MRRVGKDVSPGYIVMDNVIAWGNGVELRLLTIMDIVTKVAYAERVKSGAAIHTIEVLRASEARYHLPSLAPHQQNKLILFPAPVLDPCQILFA